MFLKRNKNLTKIKITKQLIVVIKELNENCYARFLVSVITLTQQFNTWA